MQRRLAVVRPEEPPEKPERQDGEAEGHEAEDEIGPPGPVGMRAKAVLERAHGNEEEDSPETAKRTARAVRMPAFSVTQSEWAVEESNLQPWD